MTKIAVILCYFGKLPENFSLFAESCRRNATIDFLLFTDDTPTHLPENMHLHPTTFAALQRRVAGCFDFAITLHTPYKLRLLGLRGYGSGIRRSARVFYRG